MKSPSEEKLSKWIFDLRNQMIDVRDSVIPYEYTSEGILKLGKAVSRRHIKMAIFGTLFQFAIAIYLANQVFPEKAITIMVVSFYLGAYYSYYLLAKRRFNKKWSLIERLENESEEWIQKIHLNSLYTDRMKPLIFNHIKLFAMNNYQSMKDLLINQNTNTDDGKHFILTRDSIEKDLLSEDASLSHFDIANAINTTSRKYVLDFQKESWTHQQPGAVNLVISQSSNEIFFVLEDLVSKLIKASQMVCKSYHQSRNKQSPSNDGNSDFQNNIVNLFSYQKSHTDSFARTPEETIFIEINRLMGLISDIVEPLIERYRLTTSDEEQESALLKKGTLALIELSEDVESVIKKAYAITGQETGDQKTLKSL